jgi:hypothetical protein
LTNGVLEARRSKNYVQSHRYAIIYVAEYSLRNNKKGWNHPSRLPKVDAKERIDKPKHRFSSSSQ